MVVIEVISENGSGEKFATVASRRHSGTLRPAGSRYSRDTLALATLVRRSRVKVRNSLMRRFAPSGPGSLQAPFASAHSFTIIAPCVDPDAASRHASGWHPGDQSAVPARPRPADPAR